MKKEVDKIEEQIANELKEYFHKNKNTLTEKKLEKIIKEKIEKRNYIKKDWQKHYAIKRIINNVPGLKIDDKRKGKLNRSINLSLAMFFYFILMQTMFPTIFPFGGLLDVAIIFTMVYIIGVLRNNLVYKEGLYNILLAFFIAPFLLIFLGDILIDTGSVMINIFIIIIIGIFSYFMARFSRKSIKSIFIKYKNTKNKNH